MRANERAVERMAYAKILDGGNSSSGDRERGGGGVGGGVGRGGGGALWTTFLNSRIALPFLNRGTL